MKTLLMFEGGGALGAFGAGAWEELSRHDDLVGPDLVAVAGSSIGAINAATVVHGLDAPDHGAGALRALWLERFATPPFPFLPPLLQPFGPTAAGADSWNAFLTGALLGTRGMSQAQWPGWQPVADLQRLDQPLHLRSAMWELLEQQGSYRSRNGAQPLLGVGAVDVLSGELRLFDSDSDDGVAPRQLAASSALPMMFDPVDIDGRLYWDGEVTRDSLLPRLVERLHALGRVSAGEPLRLVTVESFPRALAALPRSGPEIAHRALNLMQLGKLDLASLPAGTVAQAVRIERPPRPEDGVSSQLDFSPARLQRLVDDGRAAVRAALAQAAGGNTAPGRSDGARPVRPRRAGAPSAG